MVGVSDVVAATLSFHCYGDPDAELLTAWMGAEYPVSVDSFESGDIRVMVVGSSKAIVVAFAGTDPTDWDSLSRNFQRELVEEGFYRVHSGFQLGLNGVFSAVRSTILDLQTAKPRYLVFTGHSQGGALATLAAVRCFTEALNTPNFRVAEMVHPSSLVTFGSPRVGNQEFASTLRIAAESGVNVTRYTTAGDPIPFVPPAFSGYRHGVAETYLTQRGRLIHSPLWMVRTWDSLTWRARHRGWFLRDCIDAHSMHTYADRIGKAFRWKR